jgi:hypothetical protein
MCNRLRYDTPGGARSSEGKGAVTIFPTPLYTPTLLALNSHKPKTPPSNKQQLNNKQQCHPNA